MFFQIKTIFSTVKRHFSIYFKLSQRAYCNQNRAEPSRNRPETDRNREGTDQKLTQVLTRMVRSDNKCNSAEGQVAIDPLTCFKPLTMILLTLKP